MRAVYFFLGVVTSLGVIAGCSTVQKAPLNSDSPEQAFDDVATQASSLQARQVDFLANESFEDGLEMLRNAREGIDESKEDGEILENLGIAKAHFIRARKEADKNRSQVNSALLQARENAVRNGVSTQELKEQVEAIDEDFRDATDDFSETISPNQLAEFQNRYLNLESDILVQREMGTIKNAIQVAEEQEADDLAPRTLSEAQASYQLAKNAIKQNPRSPSEYRNQVLKANRKAKLLKDVMAKLTGDAIGSPERVALELVAQDRKIGKLSNTLGVVSMDLTQTENQLMSAGNQLISQEQKLRNEKVMESVRKDIPSSQAEVYTKGGTMIIRMKDMGFPVGSADVPKSSKQLLGNIQDKIGTLEPESVLVQGHTDSQGSTSMNQKLSQERAQAVATLLAQNNPNYKIESKGFGESQPLTSNNTKAGRRTNRRVDLIVKTR